MKKEVMIVQRIFTDYRKALFDLLAEREDIIVIHSKNDSGIKQIETPYSKKIFSIRYGRSDTNVFMFLCLSIFKFHPKIIVHEFAIGILSLFFVLVISKIFNIKLILWSHGYDRKKGFNPNKSFGDKIRLFYLKKADALLLYGENDKNLLKKYINKDKIFVAENTFDTEELLRIYRSFEKIGREKAKKKNKIVHKHNLIFIGRLLQSKSPEILIDIYEKIKDRLNNDIGVHFIGDGETLSYLQKRVKERCFDNNFSFHGAVYDYRKTGELLYCSDLMVMPGALGLSVIHAFCFGCPVVSFNKGQNGPFHGPEVDYVINGKTGFLIDSNIDDMSEVIFNYLNDPILQERMRNNTLNFVKDNCTLIKMSEKFMHCLDYCK